MNELEYIVNHFSDYSSNLNYIFSHGFASEFNEQINEGTSPNLDETFVHLFEIEPTITKGQQGFLEFDTFRCNLFIGKKSELRDKFYSKGHLVKDRHHNYFVPLWDELKSMLSTTNFCDQIDVIVNSAIKRINYQDHNLDGFLVNLTLKIY